MAPADPDVQRSTIVPEATARLAAFAAGLRFTDLPPAVVAHLRLAVLDALGCGLHGATLPWTAMVSRLVQADGGTPEASLFDGGGKAPAAAAVLVNATAGHAFELDDIHRDSIIHPNSLTVPVALAMAERAGGASGEAFLAAVAAGYEVATRIGAAAGSSLLLRGFHPQGTTGAFAAAATAGSLLGLDAERMRHALGIAGSLGAGLMAAQEGAMVKRLHSGRAAEAGVRAALLAADGFTGIPDIVEVGYGGFLSAHADAVRGERLLDGLGEHWEVLATGTKPHATVTSVHAALDALQAIMRENGLAAGAIARIEAAISTPTYVHCAWPYRAQSVTAAQMNIHYCLAVMALDGAAFTDQFREGRIADPAILDLAGRVEARVDPAIDALGPAFRHMARVTVVTADGRRLEREVRHRRGSPENPVGAAELEAKFRALTAARLPPARQDETVALAAGLDRLADVRTILAALGLAGRA